jgi:hypothetical protein
MGAGADSYSICFFKIDINLFYAPIITSLCYQKKQQQKTTTTHPKTQQQNTTTTTKQQK